MKQRDYIFEYLWVSRGRLEKADHYVFCIRSQKWPFKQNKIISTPVAGCIFQGKIEQLQTPPRILPTQKSIKTMPEWPMKKTQLMIRKANHFFSKKSNVKWADPTLWFLYYVPKLNEESTNHCLLYCVLFLNAFVKRFWTTENYNTFSFLISWSSIVICLIKLFLTCWAFRNSSSHFLLYKDRQIF